MVPAAKPPFSRLRLDAGEAPGASDRFATAGSGRGGLRAGLVRQLLTFSRLRQPQLEAAQLVGPQLTILKGAALGVVPPPPIGTG